MKRRVEEVVDGVEMTTLGKDPVQAIFLPFFLIAEPPGRLPGES
jgi:hypothetical protein